MHPCLRPLVLSLVLVGFWRPAAATSVVILANKTQIGVAADSKAMRTDGQALADTCKIWRQGNFFFALSGTVSRGTILDTRYNAMDILVQASKGLSDLEEIDRRFDQLIASPLQQQITFDFAHFRVRFLERMRGEEPVILEMVLFEMTAKGPMMIESVFPVTIAGKNVSLGRPYHHICKEGLGECSLVAGDQDAIKKYLEDHEIGEDLASEAEKFVRIEARDRPQDVGGRITVIQIDSKNGVHRSDSRDPCPMEWRKRP